MKKQKHILATGEVYHVYSRSIIGNKVFPAKNYFSRFIKSLQHYSLKNPPLRFSHYYRAKNKTKIKEKEKLVNILSYCIMPNHFHLLLVQLVDNGISIFMSRLLNSYVRFYNTKLDRKGPLWEGRFKRVRIESDNQLLHLTRYIHLNPTTSLLVAKPQDYQHSSYSEYLKPATKTITDPFYVLGQNYSISDYKTFVNDRIDYQQELNKIKNSLLE